MKTLEQIVVALEAPFPPEQIEWRVGSTNAAKDKGMALAYLTSRMVMDRLDDVCGPFGWQIDHRDCGGGKVTALISIKNPETGEWITKSDGAGATDVEGDKGAYSDACKRAAVQWRIGRYLYAVESPWVSIAPVGKSYKIADHEFERLYAVLPGNDPKKGLTVHEPTGISKEPAKFWSERSYNLLAKLPAKFKEADGEPNWALPATVAKMSEITKNAINKAPSRLALTKLQADNLAWISSSHLTPGERQALMDDFVIRAQQFDQQAGKKAQ